MKLKYKLWKIYSYEQRLSLNDNALRATLLNVYYGNTPRDIKSVSICD